MPRSLNVCNCRTLDDSNSQAQPQAIMSYSQERLESLMRTYAHVMYGQVLPNGNRYIYDPQIGQKMNWGDMIQRYDGGAKAFLME